MLEAAQLTLQQVLWHELSAINHIKHGLPTLGGLKYYAVGDLVLHAVCRQIIRISWYKYQHFQYELVVHGRVAIVRWVVMVYRSVVRIFLFVLLFYILPSFCCRELMTIFIGIKRRERRSLITGVTGNSATWKFCCCGNIFS